MKVYLAHPGNEGVQTYKKGKQQSSTYTTDSHCLATIGRGLEHHPESGYVPGKVKQQIKTQTKEPFIPSRLSIVGGVLDVLDATGDAW